MGYCCEEDHVASVYKLHSVDTLDNLLDKDEFQWRDRMTAALGITRIFRFFGVHGIGHRIHATLPCYIILDQGSNPVLSDVRVLSGGIMLLNEGRGDSAVGNAACFFGEDATVCQIKPNGIFALGILLLRLAHEECNVLEDVKTKLPYVGRPSSSYSPFNSQMKRLMVPQSDIFALGGLLMSLLCKRDMAVVIRSFIYEHVEERFKSKSSHAHESFVSHPSFDHHDAHNLTKLAMDCLGQDWLLSRPTASEIVERLRSLSLFSNTLLSTNIKVKIIESYAITERKPSWQKNLGLFKKFSITYDKRKAKDKAKKSKQISSDAVTKEKEITEGPKISRPTIFASTPEKIRSCIEQIDESLMKPVKHEIQRELLKNEVKRSQSNFIKQFVIV